MVSHPISFTRDETIADLIAIQVHHYWYRYCLLDHSKPTPFPGHKAYH